MDTKTIREIVAELKKHIIKYHCIKCGCEYYVLDYSGYVECEICGGEICRINSVV